MTPSHADSSPLSKELLTEAAEWRLIGLLFEPPDDDWRREVAELGASVQDPLLREAAESAQFEGDPGHYHSTFGPGGPASPREVTYQQFSLAGSMMSEIRGYYEAFRFVPECNESPDHVAMEAGFIGYLRLKEAYARNAGADEHAAVTAEAAGRFLRDHLAILASRLDRTLAQSGARYLSLAAQTLHQRTGPAAELQVVAPCIDDESTGCGCEE
jgi:nitrate reductase assembly molybdenum cofactor insertion protein NarJ